MNLIKILPFISLLLSLVLGIAIIAAYPMWDKISKYLNVPFIAIPFVVLFAVLITLYSLFLLFSEALFGPWAWGHIILTGLFILVMISPIFTSEAGLAREIARRYITLALPYALWIAAWVGLFLLAPYLQSMTRPGIRFAILLALLLAPLIWHFVPWRVAIKTSPVVFIQQDGMLVAWETNMRATALVDYGTAGTLKDKAFHQVDGLKNLSLGIQRVFLPGIPAEGQLTYQVSSEGVRNILPSFALKAGNVQSDVFTMGFPEKGQDLTLVAFSDIHEQRYLYRRLQNNLDWSDVDLVLFLGDLLNYSDGSTQAARAILDMPTGGRNLPRVYLRGNHETRGETARQLRDWLLPPGGKWYFTFTAGNTFFVVVDSGEDKPDSHPEYSGLNDFASYHREQAAWLEGVFASPEYQQAERKVVLIHIPLYFDAPPELAPIVDMIKSQPDIDLVMSGHTHQWGIFMPGETGLPYPLTTCGGSQVNDMAAVKVVISDELIRMTLIDMRGNVIEEQVVK